MKGKDQIPEKCKKIYKMIIITEIILCGLSFFVPNITGKSYLPNGTTHGGVIVNTKSAIIFHTKSQTEDIVIR